ncbi:MAG: nucleoside-diphosphate sugar epimerase/dehydratase [Oscillospiraceae bacterium]|nr:nucleoside-diphosphate sugar epimerase/dehydratase [Oscillospiraceae bacterium]
MDKRNPTAPELLGSTEVLVRKTGRIRTGIIIVLQIVIDIGSFFLAYLCSLLLRFGGIPKNDFTEYIQAIFIQAGVYFLFFVLFSLYRTLWKTAGIDELLRVTLASILAAFFGFLVSFLLDKMLPFSVYLAGAALVINFTGFSRIAYRLLRRVQSGMMGSEQWRRTMIVGAGEMGSAAIRQMNDQPWLHMRPLVAVDDDRSKLRRMVRGVPVEGTRVDIPRLAQKHNIDLIVLCLPRVEEKDRREIIRLCSETTCAIKTMPSLQEIMEHKDAAGSMRDIDVGDLLTRTERKLDEMGIREYLLGRTVLVTGGGGSIGSELCRQIGRFDPDKLVIFDVYENSAYDLSLELNRLFPKLDCIVEIGSVRDEKRLDELFTRYKPQIVFHAAAHKHVPLMEHNPAESVKNNVFGTLNTAKAALDHDAQRFILISTDKAVNPTSVMGASKRMAEYVIQYLNSFGRTRYAAVRFGNVLGSNGSVIPLFRKQIEAGGPITVTDKNITRYFMTIPEAARLVLQAGIFAKGGEIFILDMGDPVRIDDIARTLIRLSGFRPDVDIKIEYSGLRPGEKLYEELFLDEEQPDESGIPGIFIGKVKSPPPEEIKKNLDWLREQIENGEDARTCFTALIKTYRPEKRSDTGMDDGTG